MLRSKHKRLPRKKPQRCDTSFKGWVEQQAQDILPFQTLPLFTLEAEQFVQEHRACMYPVLPTMQGVHAEMIAQVMDELVQLYRDDEVTLSQQYTWMSCC
jgi:hypothetical protein